MANREYDYTLLEEENRCFLAVNKNSIIDWSNIFENNNPIILEIGCGNGHFIIKKAIDEPNNNFIGVDLKRERVIRCREKEKKAELNNLRWIVGDAYLAINDFFKNNLLTKIYMLFPDPWPKRKHHKNRLFKKEFIDIVFDKLISNGIFIFVTDHEEYYAKCLDIVKEDKRFDILDKNEFDENYSTSLFGKRWEDERKIFNVLIFRKNI